MLTSDENTKRAKPAGHMDDLDAAVQLACFIIPTRFLIGGTDPRNWAHERFGDAELPALPDNAPERLSRALATRPRLRLLLAVALRSYQLARDADPADVAEQERVRSLPLDALLDLSKWVRTAADAGMQYDALLQSTYLVSFPWSRTTLHFPVPVPRQGPPPKRFESQLCVMLRALLKAVGAHDGDFENVATLASMAGYEVGPSATKRQFEVCDRGAAEPTAEWLQWVAEFTAIPKTSRRV
jgi:hypothetical protein